MSDSGTLCDSSDEETMDEEYISVGGKAPHRIGPIMKYIPANGTANRVMPVSDEAFEIVILQLTQWLLQKTTTKAESEMKEPQIQSAQAANSKLQPTPICKSLCALLIGLKLTPIGTSKRHTSRMDDLNCRLHHLEERVGTLEREREKDQQIIKELQDEMSSRKRRRNESGDGEEARKSRKCRHLGTWEEPIVLELRGEEICLRTGYVKSNHSR